ncbi:MAG: hypothetical protein HZA35_03200 [Parcubacteria group bacterium]|nr:hypothetical protein [Parcubacteria group bacterium]
MDDFITMSVSGLGLERGAAYKDIIIRATKFGLRLCSSDEARLYLQYRRQHKDQQSLKNLLIAMNPVISGAGIWSIFAVTCDYAGLDYYCVDADPEKFWGSKWSFIFLRKGSSN